MDFQSSEPLTYGLELELQIVRTSTGRLHPGCLQLLDALSGQDAQDGFAKEATLATIEFNSSVHRHASEMAAEAHRKLTLANAAAETLDLGLRGGGTHLAQFWNERVMAPTERAATLAERYGFLPKRFSTYGMHVHVGMPDAAAAVRVANVLQALCPLFIALSAASPYLQLSDTGFASSRALEPVVYPHGGPMPFVHSWQQLEDQVAAYRDAGIAQSLKDIYWDVRPKPEFGTVEVRVFDTPLRLAKALSLASLTRALAGLALQGHLQLVAPAPEAAARVSRFLACRDGLDARIHDPMSDRWLTARAWLSELLALLARCPPSHGEDRDPVAWQTLLDDTPDHVLMRTSWAQQTPADQSPAGLQPALVQHHHALAAHLLS